LECPHCNTRAPANVVDDFVAALTEMRAQVAALSKRFSFSTTLESEDLAELDAEDDEDDDDEDDEDVDEDDDDEDDDDEDLDEDDEDLGEGAEEKWPTPRLPPIARRAGGRGFQCLAFGGACPLAPRRPAAPGRPRPAATGADGGPGRRPTEGTAA